MIVGFPTDSFGFASFLGEKRDISSWCALSGSDSEEDVEEVPFALLLIAQPPQIWECVLGNSFFRGNPKRKPTCLWACLFRDPTSRHLGFLAVRRRSTTQSQVKCCSRLNLVEKHGSWNVPQANHFGCSCCGPPTLIVKAIHVEQRPFVHEIDILVDALPQVYTPLVNCTGPKKDAGLVRSFHLP